MLPCLNKPKYFNKKLETKYGVKLKHRLYVKDGRCLSVLIVKSMWKSFKLASFIMVSRGRFLWFHKRSQIL